ncbi:MAG: phosphatidylglycerophosphatase A [Chitinispirillaceae bacterium]|nr:phosphatidylglycerophosphatase A [Chitinispirillaceae bacterium]
MSKGQTFSYYIRRCVASLFFLGFFPIASGTVGSAAAVALIWYLKHHKNFEFLFGPSGQLYWWIICIFLTGLSITFSSRAKETFGSEDPHEIIIDEFAGQFITFLFVPITLRTLLAGFFLFRFFDIIKPYPVAEMQDLSDSVGITMDDVVAGVYANCSLLLILTIYHLIKGYL